MLVWLTPLEGASPDESLSNDGDIIIHHITPPTGIPPRNSSTSPPPISEGVVKKTSKNHLHYNKYYNFVKRSDLTEEPNQTIVLTSWKMLCLVLSSIRYVIKYFLVTRNSARGGRVATCNLLLCLVFWKWYKEWRWVLGADFLAESKNLRRKNAENFYTKEGRPSGALLLCKNFLLKLTF